MQITQIPGFTSPAERALIRVISAEASASIPAGSPACFVFNGTNDGVAVVLPSTGAAAKSQTLFSGVVPVAIAAGAVGDCIVFGFCNNLRLVRATRAASTDAWASTPALAIGDALVINTVYNAFSFGVAGASTAILADVVAGQSLASATTLASSSAGTADTRLADTTALRAFVRAM